MKKFLKLLGMCIGLLLINFISTLIASIIFAMFTGGFRELSKYVYTITFIGEIIALIPIYSIFLEYDKKLLIKDTFKKIKSNEVINISLFGVGLSVILFILTQILAEIFPSYMDVNNQMTVASNSVVQLIIVILFIPIYEELIFRRIIFGYLKENYNIVCAVIVQALIFGLAHGNIVQGIYASISGVAFALIYIYCDSLIGSIMVHSIFNLCGILVLPTLVDINEIMGYIVFISGILCLVFSILKIKKNMNISFINRECNN